MCVLHACMCGQLSELGSAMSYLLQLFASIAQLCFGVDCHNTREQQATAHPNLISWQLDRPNSPNIFSSMALIGNHFCLYVRSRRDLLHADWTWNDGQQPAAEWPGTWHRQTRLPAWRLCTGAKQSWLHAFWYRTHCRQRQLAPLAAQSSPSREAAGG